MSKKILYVDDDQDNLQALKRVLHGKFDVDTAITPSEAFYKMKQEHYPVIVTDQRMPEKTGVKLLMEFQNSFPYVVGILITAYTDFDALIEGINKGVIYRYLQKPWNETDLTSAIKQAYEKHDLVLENQRLIEELKKANAYMSDEINESFDYSFLSQQDEGLKEVVQMILKVAPTTSTVLIRGESGSGKELVARSIHQNSSRKNKPFVRVNCGAISESLLESELFGHEKGSFTGATAQRIGRFEMADGGTLFLDEIGDISPKLQVSLLRLIQERQFERVGGNETIEVNVRLIAATHQNLEQLCQEGKFREDLYYRLNVFPIHVPPLRDRLGDIPMLSRKLLERAGRKTGIEPKKLNQDSLKKLKDYDWPGNVRELENILERALILSTSLEITPDDLILGDGIDSPLAKESVELTKEKMEEVLLACQGNKVEAARKLGIKRPTLYYHLKRLGIT